MGIDLHRLCGGGLMPTTDDYPYCPYCGEEHPGYMSLEEGKHVLDCRKCSEDFEVEVEIHKWYHTRII